MAEYTGEDSQYYYCDSYANRLVPRIAKSIFGGATVMTIKDISGDIIEQCKSRYVWSDRRIRKEIRQRGGLIGNNKAIIAII